MSAKKHSFDSESGEDFQPPFTNLPFPEHLEFAERIRKTLYYGILPTDERPSLPMTGLAVDFLRGAAPKELGKIDMYWAADVGRKAYVSPCSLMLGMIYIERLKHKNPDYLNQVSSSDLFLISMMVASKYLYDEGIDEEVYNDEWAESADMDLQDINQLEREFLTAINWSLFTQPEDFERLLQSMEERIALTQGLDRGGNWSYSDVMVLLSNVQLQDSLRHVLQELCKVVFVCSVAYTAGTVTLLGSRTAFSILRSHVIPVYTPQISFFHSFTPLVASGNTEELHSEGEDQLQELGNISAVDETWLMEELKTDHQLNTAFLPQSHLQYSSNDFVAADQHSSESLNHNNTHNNPDNETTTADDMSFEETTAEKVKSGLSFTGFLTLALIKDTVTQFLMPSSKARNLNRNCGSCCQDNGSAIVDSGLMDINNNESVEESNGICRCSGCPSKVTSRRQKWLRHRDFTTRKTNKVNCIMISPYGLWSSLKNSKRCFNNMSRCIGKCASGPLLTGIDYDETTDGNFQNADGNFQTVNGNFREDFSMSRLVNKNGGEYLTREHLGKCVIKDSVKANFGILPCRIETNFVDLTSRFETSAQMAIAG